MNVGDKTQTKLENQYFGQAFAFLTYDFLIH